MRYAIYTRVSTEEQALHGLSLTAQETALRSYVENVKGKIVDIYSDEGYSATTLERPGLKRLLEDVKKGLVDMVLFTKLDRLTRGVANYYKVMNVFELHSTNWKTTLEEYDSSTAAGRLHINIMLSVAENESAVIKERINFVFSDKLNRGEVLSGKVTLGYKIENKRYVLVKEEAELVKEIYNLYIKTGCIKEVFNTLKDKYPDKFKGKSPGANHAFVRRILKKELYTGVYVHKGVRYENFAPKIIDEETFMKVQELLNKNKRETTKRSCYGDFFKGLLFCPFGRKLTTNVTNPDKKTNIRKYHYIRCIKNL